MNSVVVVESPAKAKTIEGYLGDSYSVIASFGHVRDMADKDGAVIPGAWSDIKWSLNKRGEKQIKEILSHVKKADHLILATDPDREGEAIAWHIYELLSEKGIIEDIKVSRAVFNSITKSSVIEAIENLREINIDQVEAYLARRVLDYIVGFNISPLLWRRLPGAKSAGRVQSVALKLICERENEREAFEAQEYWTVGTDFLKGEEKISSQVHSVDGTKLKKFDISNEGKAKELSDRVKESSFAISEINKKPVKRNPKPPFITSTLQQEAARKLRFSADQTMRTAQTLYEQSFITYMRTDSPVMSKEGIDQCRKVIEGKYGSKFLPPGPRIYKSKSKQAQEAHEAIRPTDINRLPLENGLSGDEKRLYELIWNRSISSQMESANVTQTEIMISTEEGDLIFKATGSQIIFKGFLEVYEEGKDEDERSSETRLPASLDLNESLEIGSVLPEQHFTMAPPRFTEASLIKELEERGIGRPSTYASIMNSIKKREYASLENKQFKPANKGRVVVSFLDSYFLDYFKYDFTADMEESLDKIAKGELLWTNLLDNFWEGFEPSISLVMELSNREVLEKLNDVLKERLFPKGNTCPDCSAELTLKNSPRFGPFIGCTNFDETGCDYKSPPFLTLEEVDAHAKAKESIGTYPESGKDIFLKPSRGGGMYLETHDSKSETIRQTISNGIAENITIEEALKWISLPRDIGLHPETNEMIQAGFARGPFVRVKREGKETFQYANLQNEEDIFSLGMNRAVELLAGKGGGKEESKDLGLDPTSKVPVFLKKGRFGAYVETDELIRKTVPKDMSDDEVTLEWAVNNLPIITYHPDDSRAVGIRRQRTRSKGWKAFVVHAGEKKELPKDMKVKDVDEATALSLLN